MRNTKYKVSFGYELSDGEKGELSETKMDKEDIVRLLIMFSPLSYKDNLKDLMKLTAKGSFMVVSMNEGTMDGETRTKMCPKMCTKFLKITK